MYDNDTGCWLWGGSKNNKGYGTFRLDNKTYTVHKEAWQVLVEPLPPRIRLDHLCLIKHCFNPDHLEPVTDKINNRRAQGWIEIEGVWYCPAKHAVEGFNELVSRTNKSACRQCFNNNRRK